MRPFSMTLALLALMAAAVIGIGLSLPLARHLYEQPLFLWISLASATTLGILLIIAPLRAQSPAKRKLIFFGLVAAVTAFQVIRLYLDRGSPPLLTASPETLAFFRELVHIVEYGLLAFVAARLLEKDISAWLLYLTALAYALVVGTADETMQWLHAFRVGDWRDVITNGVSAASGLFYHAGLSPSPPRRVSPAENGWLRQQDGSQ